MAGKQEDNAFLAQLAQILNEMLSAMEKVALIYADLTVEKRNLLSVAYEKVIIDLGPLWTLWENNISIEQKEELNGFEIFIELFRNQRIQVEKEMIGICLYIIDVCNNILNKHHRF